jgi:hypothetical protein
MIVCIPLPTTWIRSRETRRQERDWGSGGSGTLIFKYFKFPFLDLLIALATPEQFCSPQPIHQSNVMMKIRHRLRIANIHKFNMYHWPVFYFYCIWTQSRNEDQLFNCGFRQFEVESDVFMSFLGFGHFRIINISAIGVCSYCWIPPSPKIK